MICLMYKCILNAYNKNVIMLHVTNFSFNLSHLACLFVLWITHNSMEPWEYGWHAVYQCWVCCLKGSPRRGPVNQSLRQNH